MNKFDKCMEFVFEQEGGYVNHPRDPGGETNFGISKRSHPGEDIKNMTRERAREIYRTGYWNTTQAGLLPLPFALLVFDGAVNSGPYRSKCWLQEGLGVAVDGVVGPNTIAAAEEYASSEYTIEVICDIRLRFLSQSKNWDAFGRGWTNRVHDLKDKAVSFIGMASPPPPPPPEDVVKDGNTPWLLKLIKAIVDLVTRKS